MKNYSLIFVLFVLIACMPVSSQNSETLKGKLERKPWAKSTQSYCAQGSDFYVLNTENASHVLQFDEAKFGAQLAKNEGKTIKIRGEFKVKKIKSTQNPMEQRPVTLDPEGREADSFECEVFEILEIR